MKRLLAALLAGLLVLGSSAIGDGTVINGSRTILGKWDASGATQTLPVKADTSLPEACTVNEMFWLNTETGGRGIYLCVATDTWQALGWSVGDTPSATCAVGEVFFDSDATAGENILACTATDTWTPVGVIVSGWVTGSGVSGNLALWDSTTGITYDSDLNWDGTTRLNVTDLTVVNTIVGSIDGNAASATRAGYVREPVYGFAKWQFRLCGFTWQVFMDEDGDGTFDAPDYGLVNGGFDTDGDCTADIPAKASASTYAEALKSPLEANPMLYLDATNNWLFLDSTAVGAAWDFRFGGPTTVDSDGDGTVDLDIVGYIGGGRGDGSSKWRFCTFPGGFSSDPFDYTAGFCAENDSITGKGAFYPVISDPNYATVSTPADIGSPTYKWFNGFFANFLYIGSTILSSNGYQNNYDGDTWWRSYGPQYWIVDADSSNDAQKSYDWKARYAGVDKTLMHLDGDSTSEYWLDVDRDGTYDLRFDGTDEPAHDESLMWDGTANAARWTAGGGGGTTRRTVGVTVDGGSSSPATGIKGSTRLAVAGTIKKWTILADTTGSVSFGVWKDALANYPPTVADSICASACPALSSDDAGEDSTLTGWTTAVSAGDVIRFNLDSVTTIKQATLIIEIEETL